MKEQNIKLGISIGDLNGIGGEIILKTFEDARMLEFCTPIIFASLDAVIEGKLNVVNVWQDNPQIKFGEESSTGGSYAIKSLKAAVEALKSNKIDVLVTAPIHKATIQSEDFNFPGHTDFLNQELEGDSLMFMTTEKLKVGLLTDHVAVMYQIRLMLNS